jgi:hypothetical protein
VVRRVDEARLNRATAWVFYYLGVTDGISASLESLKAPNPEPPNDAEWRTKLRSFLPPELAALRHPNANQELAARIIVQEFMRGLQRAELKENCCSQRSQIKMTSALALKGQNRMLL